MHIISSRKLLFQQVEYEEGIDPVSSKPIRVEVVKAKILVNADTRPQIVPDWVKDDELYKMHVEDGTVIEVVVGAKVRPDNALPRNFSNIKADVTPVAKFVGEENKPEPQQPKQETNASATGWGVQPS